MASQGRYFPSQNTPKGGSAWGKEGEKGSGGTLLAPAFTSLPPLQCLPALTYPDDAPYLQLSPRHRPAALHPTVTQVLPSSTMDTLGSPNHPRQYRRDSRYPGCCDHAPRSLGATDFCLSLGNTITDPYFSCLTLLFLKNQPCCHTSWLSLSFSNMTCWIFVCRSRSCFSSSSFPCACSRAACASRSLSNWAYGETADTQEIKALR